MRNYSFKATRKQTQFNEQMHVHFEQMQCFMKYSFEKKKKEDTFFQTCG